MIISGIHALLLLPTPPDPPSSPAIHAAFSAAIQSVVRFISRNSTSQSDTATLDIAVPCTGAVDVDRARNFERVNGILGEIYSLLHVILLGQASDHGRIDARVLPLAWSPSYPMRSILHMNQVHVGCPIELSILVQSGRPWTQLFSVDGEQGTHIYKQFRTTAYDIGASSIRALVEEQRTVPGGPVLNIPSQAMARGSGYHEAHHSVWACSSGISMSLADKLLITMAAFLLEARPRQGNPRQLRIGISGSPAGTSEAAAIRRFIHDVFDFRNANLPASPITTNDTWQQLSVVCEQTPESSTLPMACGDVSAVVLDPQADSSQFERVGMRYFTVASVGNRSEFTESDD